MGDLWGDLVVELSVWLYVDGKVGVGWRGCDGCQPCGCQHDEAVITYKPLPGTRNKQCENRRLRDEIPRMHLITNRYSMYRVNELAPYI